MATDCQDSKLCIIFYYIIFYSILFNSILFYLHRAKDEYESSSSSITDAATDEQDAPWHRRYESPPMYLNGYFYVLAIYILPEQNKVQVKQRKDVNVILGLLRHDSHNPQQQMEECTLNYLKINEQTLANLCTHYVIENTKMIILNSICQEDFELDINPTPATIKICTNYEIISHYSSFLKIRAFNDDSLLTDLTKDEETIWQFTFNESFNYLTKLHLLNMDPRNGIKFGDIILKLHKQRKVERIEDPVNGDEYLIYYQPLHIYILKLISKQNHPIYQYNIRRRYLSIVIYNGLLFHLTHLSHKINIWSLASLNKLGQIRTYIERSRLRMHLVLIKRVIGTYYVAIFAGMNKSIPKDILTLIDLYIDIHHFKYIIASFNRITEWNEKDEDIVIPTLINMNKIMSHLNYLCLLE